MRPRPSIAHSGGLIKGVNISTAHLSQVADGERASRELGGRERAIAGTLGRGRASGRRARGGSARERRESPGPSSRPRCRRRCRCGRSPDLDLSPFQREFSIGCFSSASAVSLTTISVKPIAGASPVPATALNCWRRLTRLVASTVVVIVTAAVVCLLSSIRSAIVLRIELTAISRYSADARRRGAAAAGSGQLAATELGRGSCSRPRRGCRARRCGRSFRSRQRRSGRRQLAGDAPGTGRDALLRFSRAAAGIGDGLRPAVPLRRGGARRCGRWPSGRDSASNGAGSPGATR